MTYTIYIHGKNNCEFSSPNFVAAATAAWNGLPQDGEARTYSIRWQEKNKFGPLTIEQAEALVPTALALSNEPDRSASLYFLGYLLGRKIE